jgi:hypothetical protein
MEHGLDREIGSGLVLVGLAGLLKKKVHADNKISVEIRTSAVFNLWIP